jgi:hypothetical protein
LRQGPRQGPDRHENRAPRHTRLERPRPAPTRARTPAVYDPPTARRDAERTWVWPPRRGERQTPRGWQRPGTERGSTGRGAPREFRAPRQQHVDRPAPQQHFSRPRHAPAAPSGGFARPPAQGGGGGGHQLRMAQPSHGPLLQGGGGRGASPHAGGRGGGHQGFGFQGGHR